MNRTHGTRQKQAEPLNRPSVDRMLKDKVRPRGHRRIADERGRGEIHDRAEGETAGRSRPAASSALIGLRNAALVAIAHDTMLRRAELVALWIQDLAPADDGSGTVLVRSSKGNKEAVDAIKYLPPDTMTYVAARLAAVAITGGPLFRPVTRGGRVGATALEAQDVRRLFR